MNTTPARRSILWPSGSRALAAPTTPRWPSLRSLFCRWDKIEWLLTGIALGALALAAMP